MLAVGMSQPADRSRALLGGVVLLALSYICFWAYRQNRVARALAEKLEQIERDMEELAEALKAGRDDSADDRAQ